MTMYSSGFGIGTPYSNICMAAVFPFSVPQSVLHVENNPNEEMNE